MIVDSSPDVADDGRRRVDDAEAIGWPFAAPESGPMIRRAFSSVFWAFVTVTSIVLYPIAVSIWVLTVAFDRRLVVLDRFTCFWASL